ncbi:MAG: DUF6384 family protein [Methyloligellaceae bacterium]
MTDNKKTETRGGTVPSDTSGVELDDIMIAMDVVDTLRHDEKLVDRELNAKGRREKLIKRLRNLYKGQGIEVPDHLLEEGVKALEDGRFTYEPPKKGFAVWLAKMYIARQKVGMALAVVLIACASLFWYSSRPPELVTVLKQVQTESRDTTATQQAKQLGEAGLTAHKAGNRDLLQANTKNLKSMLETLRQNYTLRIVTGKGERSGVWRIPKSNRQARNYYLVVEAVTKSGKILALNIRNEETGKTDKVTRWGIRVDKSVYDEIARDKQDDGIIQNVIVGEKQRGFLKVEYKIAEPRGSITKW